MAAPSNENEALDELVKSVPSGIILPPKSIRLFIEHASGYVKRGGAQFEERLRQGSHKFVDEDDPYHGYYKWRLAEVTAGRGLNIEGLGKARKGVTVREHAEKPAIQPPEEFKFSARMPTINAQDLDTVKLTALWAAKNGKSWVTGLSQRRAGEASFDFLRPQHSLNMFFNRLVEQYKDLLEGDAVDNGQPQKKRVAELEMHVNNRFHLLDRAKKRAEYVKYQEAQKVEKEERAEKEKIAFAQIDWHDFVVVETILFDERDDTADLRQPMLKNDLLSQSLEQKAAMRIGSDRLIEEAVPEFDYSQVEGWQSQAAQHVLPPQPPSVQTTPAPAQAQAQAYVLPPPDQDTSRVSTLQAERERVRGAQEAARNAQQPTRIRSDYVPQAQRRKQAQNTSICPNCKQMIPNDEMQNHLRIEMLDPRWREQSRINQQRSSTTNLSTADVANNLKRLASQRTDVFDRATGQTFSEEEQARRKRVETESNNGVGTGPNSTMGQVLPPGMPPGAEKPDVQEQIRSLHERYKK